MKQTTDNTHSFRPRGSMRVPLRPMPTMEQIEQEMRQTEAGFYVVAAAANELASVAVFDAMDTLRRNGFHGNKEARKWATKCEKDIHSYETMMRIRLQDASRRMGTVADDGRDKYTLWLDTTDRVDEEMKPHMDRLYYAVKMVMDRYSTPHSETLARMWTAHIMLQFAIRQFDTIFSDQKSRTGKGHGNPAAAEGRGAEPHQDAQGEDPAQIRRLSAPQERRTQGTLAQGVYAPRLRTAKADQAAHEDRDTPHERTEAPHDKAQELLRRPRPPRLGVLRRSDPPLRTHGGHSPQARSEGGGRRRLTPQ